MLICNNCGALFESPIVGIEEDPDMCPNCHSWDITEAKKCKICGEWCGDEFCDDCSIYTYTIQAEGIG